MLNYFIQIQGKRSSEKEKTVFSAGVHRKQRRFVRVHFRIAKRRRTFALRRFSRGCF